MGDRGQCMRGEVGEGAGGAYSVWGEGLNCK